MSDRIVETSKFLSYVLRHRPDAIGIELDSEGWSDIDALVAAAVRDNRRLDRALIEQVVASNDKKRFAISNDGLRIRAVQGHSTATVRIAHRAVAPPPMLYHGTASRFVAAILRQGLRPGARHHVHRGAGRGAGVHDRGRRRDAPWRAGGAACRRRRHGCRRMCLLPGR